jgi:demethoxyubiquinone hydroxylase (CLK1/Coq7/Cat5 family)
MKENKEVVEFSQAEKPTLYDRIKETLALALGVLAALVSAKAAICKGV